MFVGILDVLDILGRCATIDNLSVRSKYGSLS